MARPLVEIIDTYKNWIVVTRDCVKRIPVLSQTYRRSNYLRFGLEHVLVAARSSPYRFIMAVEVQPSKSFEGNKLRDLMHIGRHHLIIRDRGSYRILNSRVCSHQDVSGSGSKPVPGNGPFQLLGLEQNPLTAETGT